MVSIKARRCAVRRTPLEASSSSNVRRSCASVTLTPPSCDCVAIKSPQILCQTFRITSSCDHVARGRLYNPTSLVYVTEYPCRSQRKIANELQLVPAPLTPAVQWEMSFFGQPIHKFPSWFGNRRNRRLLLAHT